MSDGSAQDNAMERFERLAWPMLPMVLRTARFLTHRDDQAEDLAQETMLKAMRAMDRFTDGSDMKAWLMTILRRTHIDQLRASRRHGGEQPLTMDVEADADRDVGRFDDQWDEPEELMNRLDDATVIEAMRRLPDEIRWTLLLVDVERMDHAEAATVLDVPVGTIKSRAHRGRAMLRDRLCTQAPERFKRNKP
ncbi:MAG: sigma-70 family RNA polymerase sigma factor [Phycisphaerales bacterium]